MTKFSASRIWTSSGWLERAAVFVEDGVIIKVEKGVSSIDFPILVPGMIELHAHGSLGYNSAEPSDEENALWLKRLAKNGTTGILPTLSSHSPNEIRSSVGFYDRIMRSPVEGGARVLGVHLEGPFLNYEKRGGINPAYISLPTIERYLELVGDHATALTQITLAPELQGATELIEYLKAHGVYVNAGHSNATAEEMRRAIDKGLDGVTHFFNAARPITHRDGGFLTAALLDSRVYCEIVSDLIHLEPDIIRLLVQCIGSGRLSIVTDAVTLTGLPDGKYGDRVVKDGSPRLENGTLTGGRYLTIGCVKALIDIGLDPWDVFRMASNTPARRIGRGDIGDIKEGCRADLVATCENYGILATIIDGKQI